MSNNPNNPGQGQPQPPFGQPQYGQGQSPPGQPQSQYGQSQPQYGQRQPASGQPQPQYGQRQPASGQPQPQYGQPQYGGPPPGYPQPGQPLAPQKKSRRWLWITLGIVGGVLILSCAGVLIAGALGISFLSQAVGSEVTAQQYYQAIEQGNYDTAYSYLASNAAVNISGQGIPLIQESFFETAARTVDTRLGKVTNFSLSSGSDTSHITVTVTRGSKVYAVHLVLVKVGNDWKIQSADGI